MAALGLSTPRHGAPSVVLPSEEERPHRHITLPNGIEALLVSDDTTDKAAACVAVKVGFLQDPDHAQGLAHFLEHMLFLGTEKYPEETSYSAYLNAHGGSSNAYTDLEDTVYFFDVNADHLEGALDIFAQFFISPLFTESATDREMHAVDSEHSKNLQQDSWRSEQLYKEMASRSHPFHRFGTGNLKTLRDDPLAAGVDCRSELLRFHARYYSASLMRLSIVGRQPLEQLQEMAERMFSPVVDKKVPRPVFDGPPPYGPEEVGKVLEVVPVKELRRVQLVWQLPALEPHYREKPQHYISHLLGHEGAGSLLSLLKARGLANDLWAGESTSTSGFATFVVSIDCTDAGLERRDEVVSAVFGYINLMREAGPSERIFTEVQDVAAMNFRFTSKKRPMDYVKQLATNMHLFPAELTVAGPSLFLAYDPDLIKATLEQLTPERMLLAVSHKGFDEAADRTEPWYGIRYSVKTIPADVLAQWASAAPDPALRLPEPNPFVATDFSLRCDDAGACSEAGGENGMPAPPALLRDDAGCRLWFKQDRKFRKPKLNVRIKFASKAVYDSPAAAVLAELLVNILTENFNEISYEASQAGLHVSISNTREALCLDFFGYNHKLPVLIERILAIVADCKAAPPSPELFDRIQDKVVKQLENYRFQQPYQHAMLHTSVLLELPRWTWEDKLAAIAGTDVTAAALAAFASKILSVCHAEIFVHGNANAAEAANIAALLDTALPRPSPPPEDYPVSRVVQLPAGAPQVFRLANPNPAESNSAIEIVYPADIETKPLRARMGLVAHLMQDRAFDQLRTKETLGYLIWTGVAGLGEYVTGMRAVIMSAGHGPAYLDSRVEAFLVSFREYLAEIPEAELEENKTALQETMLEKDKNLNEENNRHWTEIRMRRYQFDRAQQLAAEVGTLTREDVLAAFDEYVAAGGASRKKLSSQVFSKEHAEEEGVPREAGLAAIDDPAAFRESRPLYPTRPPVAVACKL